MSSLGIDKVEGLLESMYAVRDRIVPCLIGDPGIGKTEGVNEFARKKGVKVVEFILSNTIPSEVSGIRMPDRETKKMEVFDDARMASLKDGDILFFDEVLEAPDILRSACLTLIQSRIMASGRKLPDVMIVAASNPVASPKSMAQSFRDRFVFVDVVCDWKKWTDWFASTRKKMITDHRIPKQLCSASYGYNTLTPRKLTALYDWANAAEDLAFVCDQISSMYSLSVSDFVRELVVQKQHQTFQEMIVSCLEGFNLPDTFKDMTATEMLEFLQALDEWPEIEKALAGMEIG